MDNEYMAFNFNREPRLFDSVNSHPEATQKEQTTFFFHCDDVRAL